MKKVLVNNLHTKIKFTYFPKLYIVYRDTIEECIYAGKLKNNTPYIYALINNQYKLMSIKDYVKKEPYSWTFSAFDAMQALEVITYE